jgi:hypothetical protein
MYVQIPRHPVALGFDPEIRIPVPIMGTIEAKNAPAKILAFGLVGVALLYCLRK